MNDVAEGIRTALAALGLAENDAAVERLAAYADMVVAANRTVNLTGARDAGAFVRGPLFDALTAATVLDPRRPVVDIGSGGGLPGIPLAILFPETPVRLVEPRGKRAAFLRTAVERLQIDGEVLCGQDRDLPPSQAAQVVSQAVFAADVWLRRGRRLVRDGGFVVALGSGDPVSARVRGAQVDAQWMGRRPWDAAARSAVRYVVRKGQAG